MQIRTIPLPVSKRFPLTISRGTSAGSDNLLVMVEHDGTVGLGEMSPFNIGDGQEAAESAEAAIRAWTLRLADLSPSEFQHIEAVMEEIGGIRSARCALDAACHDWLGKRAGLPVWQLFGADLGRIVPTSLTIGINTPEIARERTVEILDRLQPRSLKIKLGCPDGIEADQAMLSAIREVVPAGVILRVDANGGWTVSSARTMIRWLAEQGIDYVEQPLPLGHEEDLRAVRYGSPLRIFVDESCRTSADIPKLAGKVDGVNLKLMKAGGIREGLRLIHTARAHGLRVMMGCMSESSVAIAASVAISSYADYLDLDSHLNLLPDPFEGLSWTDGRVLPSDQPGLGVRRAAQ